MNKTQQYINNILKGVRGRLTKFSDSDQKKAGLSWMKEKRLKHMPYNHPGSHDLDGNTVEFNNGPELLHSLKEIYIEEVYKVKFDSDMPRILDCGANIGLAALYFKKNYPGAIITAFEPDPLNFQFLKKNIENNNLKNVELRNEAVWTENTTIQFASDGTLGSKIAGSQQHTDMVNVAAIRLKDLLNEKTDFLKLDIEGAEYEVLKDCRDSLGNITHLFIEFHGYFDKMYQLTDILQMVQDKGFVYYIKEATNVYPTPFYRENLVRPYDIQLNIFCFKLISKN